MKSELGKTLRKIRKAKHVSLCSIADNNLSKSQISRFERGESEISCIRLINILDKLNISLDEFLTIHDNNYTKANSFANLLQYIRKQYSSQSISNITALLFDTSDYVLNSYEKTMVKAIIHTVDDTICPTEEELFQLTDYLFKIEKWTYYEIILLGNCVESLNYNSYFLLTKELLKKHIYSSLNKTYKRLVTQSAINCLLISTDKEKFTNCTYLIDEIKELLENELNYYEQTIFLYATGYFEFKKNKVDGIKKMKDALLVFDILGEQSIKSQYLKHFQKHVNKN